jgi:hypothetical protein
VPKNLDHLGIGSDTYRSKLMAGKKSKTDVTARDKSGRATTRCCEYCGGMIGNDRDMVVVMDGRRRNKTYYSRACWQHQQNGVQAGSAQARDRGSCGAAPVVA